MTLILTVAFENLLGPYLFLHFNISTEDRASLSGGLYRYTPLTRTIISTMKRMIGRKPLILSYCASIAQSSGLSCNLIVISYNTRVHCTTVAHRRKIHRKCQCVYIAQRLLWIVRVSYRYFFICDYFSNSLQTIFDLFVRTKILSLLLLCQWWKGVKVHSIIILVSNVATLLSIYLIN